MAQKMLPKLPGGHILPPSLAPLTTKVSQAEMEAARLRGSLCLRFFLHQMVFGLGSLVFDLWRGMIDPYSS